MKHPLAIKDKILLAALEKVTFDGWSWDVVVEAGEQEGFTKNEIRAVFHEHLIGVLDHFAGWADRQMLEALNEINPEDHRIRDRIRTAVLKRFEALDPHKDALRQSLQFWLWPTRKPRAAKISWRTADVIWNWAGDTVEDYNRYTKRGLLCGVIASTTLVWLNDSSQSMEKTTAFLDKRIDNVMQLGKGIQCLKQKTKYKTK